MNAWIKVYIKACFLRFKQSVRTLNPNYSYMWDTLCYYLSFGDAGAAINLKLGQQLSRKCSHFVVFGVLLVLNIRVITEIGDLKNRQTKKNISVYFFVRKQIASYYYTKTSVLTNLLDTERSPPFVNEVCALSLLFILKTKKSNIKNKTV